MQSRRALVFAALLAVTLAGPASASFHITQIEQVVGGVNGDNTVQAIQLRMRASLQNQMQNGLIHAWDATGNNPVLIISMGASVPNSAAGSRVLIGSPGFSTHTSPAVTPNFTMTNRIPASYLAAGSLTFEDHFGTIYWRVSWGGATYTGGTDCDLLNDSDGDTSPPFADALPSTTLQALQFKFAATALSTNSANDYAVTAGAATFTNNAGQSGTLIAVTTFTITASAGAGGSISPAGSVVVNQGANQSFTITPASCKVVSDVLVDGVSVGAVTSYAFTNVQANHTIAASFATAPAKTITASAGAGGSISPSGAVSVACGASQSFTITPSDACHSITDVVVDGVSRGAVGSYAFTNVTANHTITASFGTAPNLTITASAASGGSISPSGAVSVACGASQSFTITPDGCHSIADVVVDGGSVGAVASYDFTNVTASHTIAASFALNTATVSPVTGLAAAQQKTGNDADGTTKIALTFTAAGGTSVEVYRKGFGGYPLYDNGGGSVPPTPGAYPPAGWTLTSVTASGQTDEPGNRDFWYYVAYAKDACGNVSTASNVTTGTLDYHLGDVTNDNTVDSADLALLGAHYGLSGAALAGFEYLDVGPTTDLLTNTRPTTDGRTDFDDLLLFGLNYTPTVSAVVKHPAPSTTAGDVLTVVAPSTVTAGDDFAASIELAAGDDLLGLSVRLGWNSGVVTPGAVSTGALMTAQNGTVLSPGAGRADATLLAPSAGITGSGSVALVQFHANASGEPHISIVSVVGRNLANQSATVTIQNPLSVDPAVKVTDLAPVIPNPMRDGASLLQYSLATRGLVELSIYSVDGRLVKTLAHAIQEPGRYQVAWDGTNESGAAVRSSVYYARFDAPGVRKMRVISVLR